ncbi:erythromycin esterase family protein [Pseudogemmobacter sp. W21_MBD1_M6]|uniref:erythromycin esterase family protein n=1 Tax=Pseudogemmobacter sp. W21_MBD1_M6 TaxID=3240271 RepID=UPI003F9DF5EE
MHLRFSDRADAGRQLAVKLAAMSLDRPVVYALPRGGVPVAAAIAKALNAPLDIILVRKIGAPGQPEVALGAIVEGFEPQTVINEDVKRISGADDAYLDRARAHELIELERRRGLYLGDHPRIDPAGRTAIVVDDGLATGATMKAALIALKRQNAARIVVALPVAPKDALPEIAARADDVVCLNPSQSFRGVGAFYNDFHQLTDEETIGLLREGRARVGGNPGPLADPVTRRQVSVPPLDLTGDLSVPDDARGIILFAHGSGSSRLSPRNRAVADALNAKGFATLLFDLLTPSEAQDRRNVFDIPLLAERVVEASLWVSAEPDICDLPLGLFGASTGGGAALLAAAELRNRVSAVVSRGGRPDLAGPRIAEVLSPTLLIVGGDDHQVIALNQKAYAALTCEKLLRLVPHAGHLFEEPGTMEAMTEMAAAWFQHYLVPPAPGFPLASPKVPPVASAKPRTPVEILKTAAEPLPDLDDPDFAAAFNRFADCRVVLLGEASHGTSEFYRARAAITKRLIEKHGFSIVAVEADWPDAATIDRYVRKSPNKAMGASPFTRFPTWMWRNREVDDFVAFLRRHNAGIAAETRVGFYGLDLYNMTASMAAVLAYLDDVDPKAAEVARSRYACLSPWSREPAAYGRASLSEGYALCEQPVTRILVDLLQKELSYAQQDGEQFFDATQNARLVANAERYYRVMYYGSHESWNLRDQHMFNTLKQILDHAGPDKKAVVWAHNSHIGDARFTDMGNERGELNIGQLCRQAYGKEAALIGFGTHTGTVAAASDWDAPMEIKAVRPSRADSYEALCHEVGQERFLVDLRSGQHDDLRRVLAEPRLERYIGVIYRPETERWSHYSYATLPDQYDAFVWFDRTTAVTPLPAIVSAGEDETYPFGL